jgi:Asp-tRNA(Asn)/Glu-tRNA(Gln) amidotransferase A subunit family amidase
VALPFSLDTSQCGSGLPIGVQLIGRSFGEAELLHLAHILEQTVGFSDKHKPPALAK